MPGDHGTGQPDPTLYDRISGGLLGVAAGDALGATLEFTTADTIRAVHGRHTEITGGGVFGWRAGQGTDDSDMTYAVARAYVDGYSLRRVADNFLAWLAGNPRDIGGTTRHALDALRDQQDPLAGGRVALAAGGDYAAGNGALMRALPTALARRDADTRFDEAAAVAAVTHADSRCQDASVAYCDLAAGLLEGLTPAQAVERVLEERVVGEPVLERVAGAAGRTPDTLRPTGYVLDTLEVGVWALLQPPGELETTLADVVNLGGDADTTGAVAGGLLGVRDGAAAIPQRWLAKLEYRGSLLACVQPLAELWQAGERT